MGVDSWVDMENRVMKEKANSMSNYKQGLNWEMLKEIFQDSSYYIFIKLLVP